MVLNEIGRGSVQETFPRSSVGTIKNMKKLFVDTSERKWSNNVTVGGRFTSDYSYPLGYWEAANHLVEIASFSKSPSKNRLFYPICFNYRQFIELCLKQLIIRSEEFYKKTEFLGYE